MIFCISVRLGRQAANAIGANDLLDEMFWLESQRGSLRSPNDEDAREIDDGVRLGRTQWYRLTRIAYLAS